MSAIKLNRQTHYYEKDFMMNSVTIVIHNCIPTSIIPMKQNVDHSYILSFMSEISALFEKETIQQNFYHCMKHETIHIDSIQFKYFPKEKGYIVELGYIRQIIDDADIVYDNKMKFCFNQELQNVIKKKSKVYFERKDETMASMEQKQRLNVYIQNRLYTDTYDILYV